jgi:DNA-binding MarR family transcriptional regulator
MEAKGLLVRERRAWSGYTRLIELTPEGIRLARQVDRDAFMTAFDKLREENERKTREIVAAMAEIFWRLRYEQ